MPHVNDYVFPSSNGKSHIRSLSHKKEEFDKLCELEKPWTQHDLRRTARSLMARVGVDDPILEKALGHKLTGVHAVYNRYPYFDEMSEALQALADEIDRIIENEPADNVAPIGKRVVPK
jgi:integrase